MKHAFLFLLLFAFAAQGQVTDLSKLSRGRFYSSDEIKDANNNIRGYFLLFESDKVAKETYELEYVVLDENLTKVTNGFITEMKYESWLVKAKNIEVDATLYKNKLLLQFHDNIQGMAYFKRYRTLDLPSNELSKPFIFVKDSVHVDPVFDRKNTNIANNMSESIHYFEGVGLMVNSETIDKKEKRTTQYLARYDDDFNQVWRYDYEDKSGKKFKDIYYQKSDEDVIVLLNRYSKGSGVWMNDNSILFVDSATGKLRNEFAFPNLDKHSYLIVDCTLTDDKIYVMGNYSGKSKYGGIDDLDNTGIYNFVFDKATGKLLTSDYFKWTQLGNKLEISESGKVKKEGYMYVHDMLLMDNGNIIVVTETFKQSPITTNNMYFFEMNEKFDVEQIFEVEKFKNKFSSTVAHSTDIKKYGLFDYIDYQDLGDGEYLFFLNDNEKNSKNRNKSTLYGIVTYVDGKFSRQTLDLKTETSTIYAFNAKKGYLMLIEAFDAKNKPAEFRLEKINY